MEEHHTGLFVYYRRLILLLASGLCLLLLWAMVIGGFKSSGDLPHRCLANGCSTTAFRPPLAAAFGGC
jgi:hypothetical protein